MSFLLDPFLAFMLGLFFSFLTKGFNFSQRATFTISAIVITLATAYSILLYLKWVVTDFLILDNLALILPIEQQIGPRIMLHSNATDVTKDMFPDFVIVIFYVLYFVWFYLGFKTVRQVMESHEPTPLGNPQVRMNLRVTGLVVFVSAGMLLFFFTMIPIDEVKIGDALGANSGVVDKEAIVKSYMVGPNAKFMKFSDELCNPDRLKIEEDPPILIPKNSNILILASEISSVSSDKISSMCQSREDVGKNFVFFGVNLATWMFLIAMFLVTKQSSQRHSFWKYGET